MLNESNPFVFFLFLLGCFFFVVVVVFFFSPLDGVKFFDSGQTPQLMIV